MQVCLIIAAAAAAATVTIVADLGEAVAQDGGKAKFDEIEVQRINVVEPDGTPRMVLSNKDRSPSVVVNGVDLGNAGTRPGMTFYNGEGDESGGLGTDNGVNGGRPWAVGQLSFDQYEQDQTLVLRYMEQEGVRGVGLAVDDRPETPLPESFEEFKQEPRQVVGGDARRRQGHAAHRDAGRSGRRPPDPVPERQGQGHSDDQGLMKNVTSLWHVVDRRGRAERPDRLL